MNLLNKYNNFLSFYLKPIDGTGFLAFRDLNQIINSQGKFKNALDFGCGSGRSSHFLQKLGLKVIGIDIHPDMIENAISHENLSYFLAPKGIIPFENESFDIVFNSFVLCEISSEAELEKTFKEMKRVCKKNGLVISVTNSDWLFSKNWLTIANQFPENICLNDGDIAKIYLKDVNIELLDYFWSEETYINCFKKAGYENLVLKKPLGHDSDGFRWLDEKIYPPYTIYIYKNDPPSI